MKDAYLKSLKKELILKKNLVSSKSIYSIYFWWWTPCELSLERTLDLLDFIAKNFDLSKCEEISFELNPNPLNQSLDFINSLSKLYSNFRFSVWIQSLENNILKSSWRNYDYDFICKFMDSIWTKDFSLNLDFISFWTEKNFSLFSGFIWKYTDKIDSVSVYTLELFDWSVRKEKYKTQEDEILKNFERYVDTLEKHDFERYEISNFSKKWKHSKHNEVYWQMWEYLWIWVSASSFLDWKRYTNAPAIAKYNKWIFEYSEEKKLNKDDMLIEKIFLKLRTSEWLVLNKETIKYLDCRKIEEFVLWGHLKKTNNRLFFTKKWFFLYNHIITEILTSI